jgi:hypothetical protein
MTHIPQSNFRPEQYPEYELISIHPQKYRLLAAFLIFASIVGFAFRFHMAPEHIFTLNRLYDVVSLFICGVVLLRWKIVLTTHHIRFGTALLHAKLQRQEVTDIVSLASIAQQNAARYPWLYKKLFNTDPKHHAQNAGFLWFKHQQNSVSFFSPAIKLLPLNILSEQQRTALIQQLKQQWHFDCPNADASETFPTAQYVGEDIGYRCVYIIFGSIALMLCMLIFPFKLHQAQHFGLESYQWLVPCIVIGVGLCYPFIQAEQKKMSILISLISGVFLGAALYFSALQLNRFYSEHATDQHLAANIELVEIKNQVQQWQLTPQIAEELGIPSLYFSKFTPGFNPNYTVHQKIEIQIRRGYFDDYFVDTDSFPASSQ